MSVMLFQDETNEPQTPRIADFAASWAIRAVTAKSDSIVTAFLCLVCAAPILVMMSLSPTLLSIASPVETIEPWLKAQSFGGADILTQTLVQGGIVSSGMAAISDFWVANPGQAVLMTGIIFSALLMMLFMSATATRLPLLPAILVTLLGTLAVPIARMTGLSDIAGFALGLTAWLGIISAQPGRFFGHRPIELEGVAAGIALTILFFSILPLFFAGLLSVALAGVLRAQPGRIMLTICLITLAIGFIGAEVAALLFAADLPLGLLAARLATFEMAALPMLSMSHAAALLVSALALFFISHGPRTFVARLAVLVSGFGASLIAGLNPMIFLAIMALTIVFGAARSTDKQAFEGPNLPLSTYACLVCFALLAIAPAARLGTFYMVAQHKVADSSALLGMVFLDDGSTGTKLAGGNLPVAPFEDGQRFTPADQAVLLKAGVEIATRLKASGKEVYLVAGSKTFSLASEIGEDDLAAERPKMIIVPRVAIEPKTDAARKALQGLLYSHYERVRRADALSPVWDVWQIRVGDENIAIE